MEMFEISYEDSNGEEIFLGASLTIKDAYEIINNFLKELNIESHYFRQWYDETKQKMKIDYGDWSKFFYIKGNMADFGKESESDKEQKQEEE